MKELKLYACKHCGCTVKLLTEVNHLMCCGEAMQEVIPNSVEASFEKHMPVYQKVGDSMEITVPHVMEEAHYIEWILVKGEKENREIILTPGKEAKFVVPYEKGALIYSYCNLHGLWKVEVE